MANVSTLQWNESNKNFGHLIKQENVLIDGENVWILLNIEADQMRSKAVCSLTLYQIAMKVNVMLVEVV